MTAQRLLLMTLLAFGQTTCSSDQQKLNTAYENCIENLAVTSSLMGYYWLTEQGIPLTNLILPTAVAVLLWSNYRTYKQVSTLHSECQRLENVNFRQAFQSLEDKSKLHKLELMLNQEKPQKHRRFSTGSLALPPVTFDPKSTLKN